MARKLSPLVAAVTLDINNWSAGIKQMQRDSTAITRSLKPVDKMLGDLGKPILAAGAAVSGALIGMAKVAANLGDTLLDASKRTGIATETLSAYKLLAEQSGTSFEALTSGLSKLSKNIFEAATNAKSEGARSFTAMGIAVKDSNGHIRNASEIFPELVGKLSKMEDGTVKVAMAQKFMGKAAADMIPFINEGAEGIRKAEEATRKYGVALTKTQAEMGDKFNDALVETKVAATGFAVSVGMVLLPALTDIVKKGNEWVSVAAEIARENPGLTKGFAAAGGVLVGAGGLLIGLQQMLKLGPAAVLVLKDLKAAMAAIALMKGVNTYADFSAGISLLGQSSVVARLGLVGLAAGIGIVIGQMINGAIAASGYQKEVDGVINSMAKYGALGPVGLIFAEKGYAKSDSDKSAAFTAKGTAALQAKLGLTQADLAANTKKAADAQAKLNGAHKDSNSAVKDAEAQYQKLIAGMTKLGEKQPTIKDQVDEMWKSLKKESNEGIVLEHVLIKARAAHMSTDDVMDKLGGTIKDVVADLFKANKEIPETTGHYYALMKQTEGLAEATEEWRTQTQATMDLFRAEAEELHKALPPVEIVRDGETQRIIDNAVALGRRRQELSRGTEVLKQQQVEFRDAAAAAAEMAKAGYSATQIENALGISLVDVTRRAKDLGIVLDPTTKKILEQSNAAQTLKDSFGESFGSITDSLTDMIVDMDFSFKRLIDIGKNTAKGLATSFLDGFMAPVKAGMVKLGEGLADAISGKGGGGLFGGFGGLGDAIGGLFKGKSGQPANGQMAGIPIASDIGGWGGGGGGLGKLSGLAGKMNYVSMGASIAKDAFELGTMITGKIGAGRDAANEIVKSQNAFVDKTLASILGDQALSATQRLAQVNAAWEDMKGQLDRFSASGGENTVVANQAFATLSSFISQIQTGLMKEGAAATGAGSGNTITIQQLSITNNFPDVTDVATMVDWIRRNFGGLTEETLRQVQLREGAVVAR